MIEELELLVPKFGPASGVKIEKYTNIVVSCCLFRFRRVPDNINMYSEGVDKPKSISITMLYKMDSIRYMYMHL